MLCCRAYQITFTACAYLPPLHLEVCSVMASDQLSTFPGKAAGVSPTCLHNTTSTQH